MKIIFGLLFFVVGHWSITAQVNTQSSSQDVIESIVDQNAEEQDTQQYGEELEYLRSHPIDIAHPSYSELLTLPMISPLLAESIILYSDSVNIEHVEQLRSVSLMTDALFEKIMPFITVTRPLENSFFFNVIPSTVELRSRTEERLQPVDGLRNGKYRGGAMSAYERLKISNRYFETTSLFEKDAGESYRNGFFSGYVMLKDVPLLPKLVVGNFNISSAQGLVFAKNISTTKGNDAVGQTRKKGKLISPSVSTDELRYFQGVASQIHYNNLSLMGFYSSRKLSAGIDVGGVAMSFYTSGSYQTTEDLKRQRTLGEQTVGGEINYSLTGGKNISLTLMNVRYDRFLKPSLFNLQGNRKISAASLSWEIPFFGMLTFGESASNDFQRHSKTVGIIIPVSRIVAVNYHHRSFTKGYVSPFAHPFGERSNIAEGELGNYIGIEIRGEDIAINAYQDYFSLPSTDHDFGVFGTETFLSASVPIDPKLKMMMHIRNKARSQVDIIPDNDERRQTNYRLSYMYKATQDFSLSQRFEISTVSYYPSKHSEKGFLTFVEGVYKNSEIGVSVKTRFIVFETESYNSRLYQFESDVAGNYSNPPMYGKGMRWYIVSSYEMFKNCFMSFKYSETKKQNELVLGSGDDQIRGNMDNYISFQLDFQF